MNNVSALFGEENSTLNNGQVPQPSIPELSSNQLRDGLPLSPNQATGRLATLSNQEAERQQSSRASTISNRPPTVLCEINDPYGNLTPTPSSRYYSNKNWIIKSDEILEIYHEEPTGY